MAQFPETSTRTAQIEQILDAWCHINRDIAALKTGEKVTLDKEKQRLYVVNRGGKTIAVLSRKASEKWHNRLDTIISAKVLGIVKREKKETSDPNATASKVIFRELPVVEILHHVVL